jgi:hypothetical protein
MLKNSVYRQTAKSLAVLIAAIVLTRFSMGLWLGVMTLVGMVCALSGKVGKSFAIYLMIICMVEVNPILLPKKQFFGVLVRFGPLLIGLMLMLRGVTGKGQSRVPLGMLMAFLLVASVSSINGWAPMVSFFKISNFIVFILAFWFGLQTLSTDREGTDVLRSAIFAYSIFLILGSALLLPFPSISQLSGVQLAMREGNLEAAKIAMASEEGNVALFCGVTGQSQAFAIQAAMALAWLIADMLFVEKRFSKFHLALLAIGVILLYYSRSRAGLFSLTVGIIAVAIWLPNKINLSFDIKRHLRTGVSVLLVIGIIGGIGAEISSGSISQWLRKVDDVENDQRSLSEAVTSSRQGLIEESMRDFRRNYLLGTGFQVAEYTADQIAMAGTGFILSAPIEKGLLPVMVLGETGIIGAIVFGIFLISFYSSSCKRRLYVTAALFTVLLATNIGEATFFSPGGGGGLLWTVSIIGGYCIDMHLARERKYAYPSYH